MAAADAMAASPAAPDAPARVETLKRRADFLAAARARRWAAQSFTLQGRARAAAESERAPADLVRIGYTCSKKVGNAVARNRAKRRLRAAAAALAPALGKPGWDYVLIGKPGATAERPFAAMLDDLRTAFARVHGGRGK